MNIHKNASMTPRGRAHLIREIERTARKWRGRWANEGAPGLLDRSSRPAHCSDATKLKRAVALRQPAPDLRPYCRAWACPQALSRVPARRPALRVCLRCRTRYPCGATSVSRPMGFSHCRLVRSKLQTDPHPLQRGCGFERTHRAAAPPAHAQEAHCPSRWTQHSTISRWLAALCLKALDAIGTHGLSGNRHGLRQWAGRRLR